VIREDNSIYDNARRLVKTRRGVWSVCKFSLCYQTYYCETRMNMVVTGNSAQIIISQLCSILKIQHYL